MTAKVPRYVLSQEADLDLNSIFDYTVKAYGFDQAVTYLNELEVVFNKLLLHPEMGRKRLEIKKDLYSISEQSHIVFYRIMDVHIRIIRVLHGQKDIPKQFKV